MSEDESWAEGEACENAFFSVSKKFYFATAIYRYLFIRLRVTPLQMRLVGLRLSN